MADPRRLTPNLAAGALLVVLAAALLLWQRPWETSTPDGVVPVPDAAASLLDEQFRELADADTERAFVAAAGTGDRAKSFATDAWQARSVLDVADVDMRYLRGGEVPDRCRRFNPRRGLGVVAGRSRLGRQRHVGP